jgi:phosphatidylserine decarboxylase
MTLHKEGTATIAIATAFSAAMIFSVGLDNPNLILKYAVWAFCAVLMIIVLQFFRKPSRKAFIDGNSIVAPADGKVVVIEKMMETEYYNEERIQVSIFMSPINVHINWNPINGLAKYVKYHPGKYLVAWHPKASTDNERTTIVLENEKGSILFRQIAGALARRICYYVKEKDQVKQGEEFGFIKFGSRVDLFLPLNAKIKVGIDEKVQGRQTVIAEW